MRANISHFHSPVRLGSSGLKVSRLILGLGTYGNKSMEEWILGEKEGIEHIKAA
jgi:aryl-alcohol dehydrogenase-like predicted oxidoreductase